MPAPGVMEAYGGGGEGMDARYINTVLATACGSCGMTTVDVRIGSTDIDAYAIAVATSEIYAYLPCQSSRGYPFVRRA